MLPFDFAIEIVIKNVSDDTLTVLSFWEYEPEKRNSSLLRTLQQEAMTSLSRFVCIYI